MTNFTSDIIAKAKSARSAADLLVLAEAYNMELTEEEAEVYFEQLNTAGVISDDELDAVAGGGSCPGDEEEETEEESKSEPKSSRVICSRCGSIVKRGTNCSVCKKPVF